MVKSVSYITRIDSQTGQMSSPDGKRKIFISYKHSDEIQLPLCERLASYILEKYDVAIWYDRQLTAGEEYDKEIQSAIRSSDAFVLLLTSTILSSAYIWEQEIPFAQKNQVAIIPVIAGMSDAEIKQVEAVIGRVHMPLWFCGNREYVPNFPAEALKQFHNGLSISIANKDLLSQVMLFYERGNHKTSLRYLNFEQIFMKAYGCLFGVDLEQDKGRGVKLMETILRSYGDDEEFIALQKQVASELLKHFYRSNQPELFIAYLKPMLEKGFTDLFPLLFDAYRQQWHPELFAVQHKLSLVLFESLYQQCYSRSWDGDKVVAELKNCEPIQLDTTQSDSNFPHIGEISIGEHTAYFQRSATEEKTVCLMLDGYCLDKYDIYCSFGDVSFLYLSYDSQRQLLISFYADFDHYGPETYLGGKVFHIDSDGIRMASLPHDCVDRMRQLPYSPHTFGFI